MSKLLKLKKWLTVSEAANYLTGVLSERVTEADIFRLSLDGNLTLSVYFVSSVHVKTGHKVPLEDAKKVPGIPSRGDAGPYERLFGVQIDDFSVLEFEEHIDMIDGSTVFDLPMVGGERINCERRYQQLTDGPWIEMTNIDGSFLLEPSTACYLQLYDSYMPKQKDGDHRNAWERRADEVWIPVGSLPEDAVFVVRIESATKLLASLSCNGAVEKPLEKRERETLLTIIAVLCKEAKLDYEKAAKSAGLIQGTAARMGISIGETTIEGHLNKIPTALGSRMK